MYDCWSNLLLYSPSLGNNSREYQIFSKVVGLNLSNFELPYGFQSVEYQIASCGECRFKPTITRAYLWSIIHLDIKTSFWHHAWGQKICIFSSHHLGFLSTHGPSSTFSLNFQACSSVEKWQIGLGVFNKMRSKKWDLNGGDQQERIFLEREIVEIMTRVSRNHLNRSSCNSERH